MSNNTPLLIFFCVLGGLVLFGAIILVTCKLTTRQLAQRDSERINNSNNNNNNNNDNNKASKGKEDTVSVTKTTNNDSKKTNDSSVIEDATNEVEEDVFQDAESVDGDGQEKV